MNMTGVHFFGASSWFFFFLLALGLRSPLLVVGWALLAGLALGPSSRSDSSASTLLFLRRPLMDLGSATIRDL